MAKETKNFYAVVRGREPGLYGSWEECKHQVHRYKNAKFKGFATFKDATDYIAAESISEGSYYGVAIGRRPGVYIDWDTTEKHIAGFRGAKYKKFRTREEAEDFVRKNGDYFTQFSNFKPESDAPFDHEFERLASSQGWARGSQEYTRHRTIAAREDMNLHFFTQKEEDDEDDEKIEKLTPIQLRLQGFQKLCREVGLVPGDSEQECRRALKSLLVNIIDFLDICRTGSAVRVWPWSSWRKFKAYSLQDDKRMNLAEAKKDGGILASLLHNFRRPPRYPNDVVASRYRVTARSAPEVTREPPERIVVKYERHESTLSDDNLSNSIPSDVGEGDSEYSWDESVAGIASVLDPLPAVKQERDSSPIFIYSRVAPGRLEARETPERSLGQATSSTMELSAWEKAKLQRSISYNSSRPELSSLTSKQERNSEQNLGSKRKRGKQDLVLDQEPGSKKSKLKTNTSNTRQIIQSFMYVAVNDGSY